MLTAPPAAAGDELYNFVHPSVVKVARITKDSNRMLTGGFDKVRNPPRGSSSAACDSSRLVKSAKLSSGSRCLLRAAHDPWDGFV